LRKAIFSKVLTVVLRPMIWRQVSLMAARLPSPAPAAWSLRSALAAQRDDAVHAAVLSGQCLPCCVLQAVGKAQQKILINRLMGLNTVSLPCAWGWGCMACKKRRYFG
jgi:hypothetical protein